MFLVTRTLAWTHDARLWQAALLGGDVTCVCIMAEEPPSSVYLNRTQLAAASPRLPLLLHFRQTSRSTCASDHPRQRCRYLTTT
jgi:hypothetical protein